MTELTLHPTPRGRDVVLEQVRVVGLRLRREALVLAVVLGIVTFSIALDIIRGTAATWFDGDPTPAIILGSVAFPFAVWRGTRRFGPAFLWTLPVDRRRHALAKVFAGWVWLMFALVVFVAWRLVLALLAGATVRFFSFTAATAIYLLGSAVILGLRHPLRWLIGVFALLYLFDILTQVSDIETLLASSGFFSTAEHAAAVWQTLPGLARWATTTFPLFGAGLVALWFAASRHGERRRH